VSALIVLDPHPLLDEIADSLSTTFQETVTSLTYHPLLPSVPETVGVITGAVVSDGGGAAFTWSVNFAGLVLYVPVPLSLTETVTSWSPTEEELNTTGWSVPQLVKVRLPGVAVTPDGALMVTVAGEESAALQPGCPSPLLAAMR
jgi:hypothetical protein